MAPTLLLTGCPGVGKTTIIQAAIARLGGGAGGFYTVEIREEGRRTGFRLVAVGAGPPQDGILASVHSTGRYRVGRYGVNVDELERVGVEAVLNALGDARLTVIVIDEIGKMELLSSRFRSAVMAAVQSPKPLVATAMSRREPWLDAIKTRSDVTQIEVTPANRKTVPALVLSWLGSRRAQE